MSTQLPTFQMRSRRLLDDRSKLDHSCIISEAIFVDFMLVLYG